MSTDKNTEEKDATLGGALLLGALVALIGALLGFMFLASVQPKAYKSVEELQAFLEKNSDPSLLQASYLEGPVSRSRGWEQKRDALLNGRERAVELSSAEINAWMASEFRQSGSPASEAEESGIMILPGVPNLFIDADEGFFLNVPADVSIYGSAHSWMVVAQGHFTDGLQVNFEVDVLHVNGAAIPVVGGLADRILAALFQAYSQTDEFIAFEKAWTKVESVELVEDTARLKLR